MPIFISYSHNDAEFVEALSLRLVAEKHNVWIDKWELNLGDSLTQKVEAALGASSAILVILSKNSVQSEWCRRELGAGLIRELEERQVLVMPCVIDDCVVPLFLRDKLHADFHKDRDAAFALLNRSLARISNAFQNRESTADSFTDWSVDWATFSEAQRVVRVTMVDHSPAVPFIVLTQLTIFFEGEATRAFDDALRGNSMAPFYLSQLSRVVEVGLPRIVLENAQEEVFQIPVSSELLLDLRCRRLGLDSGMDTLVDVHTSLERVMTSAKERIAKHD